MLAMLLQCEVEVAKVLFCKHTCLLSQEIGRSVEGHEWCAGP